MKHGRLDENSMKIGDVRPSFRVDYANIVRLARLRCLTDFFNYERLVCLNCDSRNWPFLLFTPYYSYYF